MHSFTVLLLGSTDGFFSFYPASLPQLFHRRSPLNFFLGADAWLLLSFVHFSFSIPLLGSLFLPFHLFLFPSYSDVLSARLPLSFLTFSLFTLTWSLMSSFQVPVLGFLFVSFRSTLIHSHSCFSGDSLVLSLSGLSASSSLSFVRVLFASSYLAFCFFRSFSFWSYFTAVWSVLIISLSIFPLTSSWVSIWSAEPTILTNYAWAAKTHSRRCLGWGTFRYSRGRLRPT